MCEWKEYEFSDLLENGTLSYGIVQPGSHTVNDSVPVIRVNNIKNGYIKTEDILKVAAEVESKYKKTRLVGGELLITVVGSVGECAIVPKTLIGWNVARAISVARIKKEYDTRFIKYAFKTEDVKHQLYGNTNDTVQPTLNLGSLKSLKITLPPLPEQKAIAEVLTSLDDKIDLLQRNNNTLGALAETLYKQKFVEESDNSWKISTVGQNFETKGGGTPSTKNTEFWDGDVFWTSPRDLSASNNTFLRKTQRTITSKGLKTISSGLLPKGVVLLSSRAPIGYLAITAVPLAINQGYIACLPNENYSPWFIHNWLRYNMDVIHSVSNGSTFMEISKGVFRNLDFLVPSKQQLNSFNQIVEPLYQKLLLNETQIARLELIRDMLLPKLMNGAIKTNEIEMA
jgi:type I restriction enzyme S subunit